MIQASTKLARWRLTICRQITLAAPGRHMRIYLKCTKVKYVSWSIGLWLLFSLIFSKLNFTAGVSDNGTVQKSEILTALYAGLQMRHHRRRLRFVRRQQRRIIKCMYVLLGW